MVPIEKSPREGVYRRSYKIKLRSGLTEPGAFGFNPELPCSESSKLNSKYPCTEQEFEIKVPLKKSN